MFRAMAYGKVIGSTIAGAALLLTLIILSFYIGDSKNATAINLAVLVFGVSLGWGVGILVSPYSDLEQTRFSAFSKAVFAFGSGYLVGKTDALMESLLDPDFILEAAHGFRLLSGLSVFTLALITTFIYRHYI